MMKPIYTGVALMISMVFSGGPVLAEDDAARDIILSPGCRMVGGLAETIMTERQNNVPMSEMMSRIQQSMAYIDFDIVPLSAENAARMVVVAYEVPLYRTPSNQQSAIGEFRNEVELTCYRQQLGVN